MTRTPPEAFERRKRRWGLVALAAVALIFLPLLVGMSGSAFAVARVFTDVPADAALPQETLSGDVARSLRLTMFGLAVSGAGLALLVLAMIRRAQLQRQSTRCA